MTTNIAKGILVQTTLSGKTLRNIVNTCTLGADSNPLTKQPPLVKSTPMSFCSYFCKGYPETYGDREGIMFETDSPVVYACPADTFELLRDGNWIPGYERFLFKSIEEMLEKYPTSNDFRKDFREYFRALNPEEVHPYSPAFLVGALHRSDYCLRSDWNSGCNEITFPKPMQIRNPRIFSSKKELEALLE
jgi:hypothetical protein